MLTVDGFATVPATSPLSLTAVESTLLQLSGAEDPEYLSFLLSLFFTQISQKLSYEQCKSLTETILGKLHTFWDSTQVSDLEILAAGLLAPFSFRVLSQLVLPGASRSQRLRICRVMYQDP